MCEEHITCEMWSQISGWGFVLDGIPQSSALGPLLFPFYINDMAVQVQHSSLLQLADDVKPGVFLSDESLRA